MAASVASQAGAHERQSSEPSNGPLLLLLKLEADVREAASPSELSYLIAAESRKLLQARQCFVCRLNQSNKIQIQTISGLPVVDRSAPMTMALEDILQSQGSEKLSKKLELNIKIYRGKFQEFASDYPFAHLLWVPFLDRKGLLQGGLLLAREKQWAEGNVIVARRLADTFAHAFRELSGAQRSIPRPSLRSSSVFLTIAAALAFIRVPVTAMAPFEIVPVDAELITSPLDGTIEEVMIMPGSQVEKGQVLLRFSADSLAGRVNIAQHEVLVAQANLKQAAQQAFTDETGRRALAVAATQVDLKTAEWELARQLLDRTEIRSQRAGIALLSDPDDLVGRPVALGEKLLKVADPSRVQASLEVALGDSSLLQSGARVKLFYDSDPLNASEAVLSSADYKSKPNATNLLAYRALAALTDKSQKPRLGARGTAQIFGTYASLGFVVFRRPWAALRQRIAM